MKRAIFSVVFVVSLATAADVQTVTIGSGGPPDGIPACSSFQDNKCCITSLVCQCYDGKFYKGNSDNKCSPTVGDQIAGN
ncbi:hypothetical protein PG988_004829 [Apiospora saccharicola]